MEKAEDNDFFDTIFSNHYAELYKLAYTLTKTKNEDAATDIVSDTFFKVVKNIETYKKYEDIRSALKKTVRNIESDRRKQKKQELLSFEEYYQVYFYDSIEHVEKILLRSEQSDLIDVALEKLNNKHKDIINLFYFEELNLREISDVTGVKYTTVLYRHQGALQALRAEFVGDIDSYDDYDSLSAIPTIHTVGRKKSIFYLYMSYLLYMARGGK